MSRVPAAPLRIALVSLHTSPGSDPGIGDAGGMNVVVRNQAGALASLGHTVDVLTRRSSPDQPDAEPLGDGVTLRFLTAGPPEPVAKGVHEQFVDEFREAMRAFGPYDVIHSHHWFSGMAALPLARELGVPHVQSFHSIAADLSTPLSEGERPESPGRLAGEAWLARETDLVVTISGAEAETVVSRLGGTPDRIAIVSPGVDGDLFHPRSTPASSGPYLVSAGRLDPLKGFDLAIEALALVAPAHVTEGPESQDARPDLVIAGEASVDYAGYEQQLSDLATSRGVGERVRFVGPQSRSALAGLLRGASAVLVPSHSETYGLVALEAAASGVPVVAAGAGGLREAVVNGVTGIVVDSREPQVWATRIERLLTDHDLAAGMGRAARDRALDLSWKRSAEQLLGAYATLL